MPNYLPSEKDMLELNLKDPDEVVEYILRFYDKSGIKSETDLLNKLTDSHPLRAAIELQKAKGR